MFKSSNVCVLFTSLWKEQTVSWRYLGKLLGIATASIVKISIVFARTSIPYVPQSPGLQHSMSSTSGCHYKHGRHWTEHLPTWKKPSNIEYPKFIWQCIRFVDAIKKVHTFRHLDLSWTWISSFFSPHIFVQWYYYICQIQKIWTTFEIRHVDQKMYFIGTSIASQ